MKTILILTFVAFVAGPAAFPQTAITGNDTSASITNQVSPAPPAFPADYSVIARSEQTRTWTHATYHTNAGGRVTMLTNLLVTELQNGIAFFDPATGKWADSSDQIQIQPDGGAIAASGPTRLYVPGDLFSDALQCVTSDGQEILTRPIGLVLADEQRSVLISELRSGPVGQLLASGSAAIFTNICDGVRCDLLVENRRAGYEASLILRERFDPSDWGFTNAATLRVQWLTEFLGQVTPQVTAWVTRDGMTDTDLDFGQLQTGEARGFLLGDSPDSGVKVYRRWIVTPDSRRILVEETMWSAIENKLGQLPPRTAMIGPEQKQRREAEPSPLVPLPSDGRGGAFNVAQASSPASSGGVSPPVRRQPPGGTPGELAGGDARATPNTSSGEEGAAIAGLPALPRAREWKRGTKQMVVAAVDYRTEPGLLWDYSLTGSLTNLVLKGGDDGTYLLGAPGAVTLRGTTIIEGGAVIKFTNDWRVSMTR